MGQIVSFFPMSSGGAAAAKLPEFTYTGNYELIDDGTEKGVQNWRIKFLTSGVLTFIEIESKIDAFLVGGGGSGATHQDGPGGGGGAGYTTTRKGISVETGAEYTITIGAGGYLWARGGGATRAFDVTATGGNGGSEWGPTGGSGGSGGGTKQGGSNGGNGGGTNGGAGQGTTTREFETAVTNTYIVGGVTLGSDWLSLTNGGSPLVPQKGIIYSVMTTGTYWYKDYIWNGTLYEETDLAKVYAGGGGGYNAAGGAGGGGNGTAQATAAGKVNTGSGGAGLSGYNDNMPTAVSGGSGIVVIRNAR